MQNAITLLSNCLFENMSLIDPLIKIFLTFLNILTQNTLDFYIVYHFFSQETIPKPTNKFGTVIESKKGLEFFFLLNFNLSEPKGLKAFLPTLF